MSRSLFFRLQASTPLLLAGRSFRAGSESSPHVDGSPLAPGLVTLLVFPARLALIAPLPLVCGVATFRIDAGRKSLFRVVPQPSFVRHVQQGSKLV